MKKTIILLCIIFSQLCAYGQYKPMLEPGKVWTQHYEFYTAGGLSDSISVLGTDSVVNGVTYQKLDGVLLPGINFSNVIGDPILVREDTALGKVWVFVDSFEYLLYDFSIMEGDTVSIFAKKMGSFSSCDSVLSFYVTKTDTFIDLNGTPRKQIEMLPLASVSNNCYFGMIPLTWIEGIGSNKGFSIVAEDFQTYMLCVSEYGAQLYQGDMTDTCWLGSTIGVENFEQQSFQIYPNPATSEVTISNSSEIYLISSIVIYDLRGNVLQRHEGLSVAEKTIDISQLRSGMYVLGIIDGDGGYYRKKLQIAR